MFALLLAACSTHVTVQSTAAVDQVSLYKGRMPTAQMAEAPLAQGLGAVTTRTPYVVGRRFWGVVEGPEGQRTIMQIRNHARGGPIAGCVVGALVVWPAAFACLYVSGPAEMTLIPTPE